MSTPTPTPTETTLLPTPTPAPTLPANLGSLAAHQSEIKNLLTDELSSISEKYIRMKQDLDTESRLIMLNENQKKRNWELIKISVIWGITFLILLIFISVKNFGLIPFFSTMAACIILFSVATIATISIYMEMNKHDPLNFDRLNYASPAIVASGNTGVGSSNKDERGTCMNQSCCSADTYFDPTVSQCLPIGTTPHPLQGTDANVSPNQAGFVSGSDSGNFFLA